MSKHEMNMNPDQVTVAELMARLKGAEEAETVESASSPAEHEAQKSQPSLLRRLGDRAISMVQSTREQVKRLTREKAGRKLTAAALALTAGVMGAGEATAAAHVDARGQAVVFSGGNLDNDSKLSYGLFGQKFQNASEVDLVAGNKSIAPVGDIPYDASVRQNAEHGARLVAEHSGDTVVSGFSLGESIAYESVWKAHQQGVDTSKTRVVTYGGGVGNKNAAVPMLQHYFGPAVPLLGDTTIHKVPGVQYQVNCIQGDVCAINDPFKNPGGALGNVASIAMNHYGVGNVPGTGYGNLDKMNKTTIVAADGTVNNTYHTDNHPLVMAGEAITGIKANQQTKDFVAAAAPMVDAGGEQKTPDMNQVVKTGAAMGGQAAKDYLPGHVANEHVAPLTGLIDQAVTMIQQAPAPAMAPAYEPPYTPPAAAVAMVDQAYQAVQPSYVAPAPVINTQQYNEASTAINNAASAATSFGIDSSQAANVASQAQNFVNQLAGLNTQAR